MNSSPEPREDFQAEASSPSRPMLTMVGLGPPLEPEAPLLAGTTAYLEEEPGPVSEQRTLVGFPPASGPTADANASEPAETPNDAITAVASYDEVTVVTSKAALYSVPAETADVVELDDVELVESEPELKIFPPSLDSFVPPPRFSKGRLVVALNVAGIALGVGSLAWVLASGQPAETPPPAPQGNRPASVPARSPLREAPLAATPATEVVSVHELDVKPKANRTEPASAPALVPVDLDGPVEQAKAHESTLTITSRPPCNVVLDGRPLGLTPHTLSVSAGTHSVVFIHPVKGRKAMQIEATTGKTAVAAMTF
ncbi:MAG TPA: PEGA domain-containing protein [Polyangiaceae bacterium]